MYCGQLDSCSQVSRVSGLHSGVPFGTLLGWAWLPKAMTSWMDRLVLATVLCVGSKAASPSLRCSELPPPVSRTGLAPLLLRRCTARSWPRWNPESRRRRCLQCFPTESLTGRRCQELTCERRRKGPPCERRTARHTGWPFPPDMPKRRVVQLREAGMERSTLQRVRPVPKRLGERGMASRRTPPSLPPGMGTGITEGA
jgi:hypothetical protein